MLPLNFFDKIKIFSFYPETSKHEAQKLFLQLKEDNIHPAKINWSNAIGNWKASLIRLGVAKEVVATEYPFDIELHFLGWDFDNQQDEKSSNLKE